MFVIKKMNEISEAIHHYLPAEKYQIGEEYDNYDSILVRSAKCHDLDFPGTLLAIARAGAGVNNIPVEKCAQDGIVVFNTPGANANGVKELVLAGMLLASRNIIEAIKWVKTLRNKGSEVLPLIEQGKKQFVGPEMAGKTLGVIGLGAIGVMVANSARALGMTVVGYDPYISVESAWGLDHGVNRAVSIDALLADADYISLHIPLMDNTKSFIDRDEIAKMKDGVVVLNFARNGLVNHKAILDALNTKVKRYVTDFPSDELLYNERVICIPHLGASTPESEENCARMAAKQLRDYLETGTIVNSVNMPAINLPFNGKFRIAVIHKNTSGMVGQMTALLAKSGENITDMVNKSKGDIAYTIINLDDVVPADTIDKINSINGVIRTRTFSKQNRF